MIKVAGTGRLTKDATVFSYANNSKTGINFSLACNQQGSDDATYMNFTKFNSGENLVKYLTMGNQIIFEGNLSVNKGNDGGYYTSVIVTELDFGAKKSSNNDGNYREGDDEHKYMQSADFGSAGYQYGENNDIKAIDDGDIPF